MYQTKPLHLSGPLLVQLSLPILLFLGLAKNRRYSETAVLGGSITFKNPIWDLKWAEVLGGRCYLEGRYWDGRLYNILMGNSPHPTGLH